MDESPSSGLHVVELLAALHCFQADVEFRDKRIIGLRARDDCHVEISTGEIFGFLAGGGKYAKLTRTAQGWQISERGDWVT